MIAITWVEQSLWIVSYDSGISSSTSNAIPPKSFHNGQNCNSTTFGMKFGKLCKCSLMTLVLTNIEKAFAVQRLLNVQAERIQRKKKRHKFDRVLRWKACMHHQGIQREGESHPAHESLYHTNRKRVGEHSTVLDSQQEAIPIEQSTDNM